MVPILVSYHLKNGNLFGRSGLVEDIFILAIASSFVAPIVKLIDPWNLLLILRFKYYHDEGTHPTIQKKDYTSINSSWMRSARECNLKLDWSISMSFITSSLSASLFPCNPSFLSSPSWDISLCIGFRDILYIIGVRDLSLDLIPSPLNCIRLSFLELLPLLWEISPGHGSFLIKALGMLYYPILSHWALHLSSSSSHMKK